eukprot:scaffold884_cov322-Pavlova_lutheri.AAC.3
MRCTRISYVTARESPISPPLLLQATRHQPYSAVVLGSHVRLSCLRGASIASLWTAGSTWNLSADPGAPGKGLPFTRDATARARKHATSKFGREMEHAPRSRRHEATKGSSFVYATDGDDRTAVRGVDGPTSVDHRRGTPAMPRMISIKDIDRSGSYRSEDEDRASLPAKLAPPWKGNLRRVNLPFVPDKFRVQMGPGSLSMIDEAWTDLSDSSLVDLRRASQRATCRAQALETRRGSTPESLLRRKRRVRTSSCTGRGFESQERRPRWARIRLDAHRHD